MPSLDDVTPPPPRFADPHRRARLAGGFPEIDRLFEGLRDRHRIPGVAYGVVIDGDLAHTAGAGVRETRGGSPVAPETVFRIASVTKSVTATALLRLRDEGRLGLDDPVALHVPELAGLRPITADAPAITVRHLLTMSGGLVEDDAWADRQLDVAPETLSAWLTNGLVPSHAPGTVYEYSNLGFAILGRVMAAVSGMPFRRYVTEAVLEPLGMGSTTWDADRIPPPLRAIGHRLDEGRWVPEPSLPDGAFGPMGGLATSVRDFARFVAFHLSAWPPRDDPERGPIRRSSSREMQQSWRAGRTFMWSGAPGRRPLADGYGYGLVSGVHPRIGRVVGHSGGLPGFGSHVLWLPDHAVGVLAFANLTYAPMRDAAWTAVEILERTGALVPRTPAPSGALLAARALVLAMYERWDEASVAAAAADNLFLDVPADRRRRQVQELRTTHGAVRDAGPIRSIGALRGEWRMSCERGAIDVAISLTPTAPPRLQTIDLTPVAGPARGGAGELHAGPGDDDEGGGAGL